jgi:hypothetical protein
MVSLMIYPMTATELLIVALKLLALAIVLSGLRWQSTIGQRSRQLYWLAAFATALLGIAYLTLTVAARIDMDVEWDFLNYWLAGRIAAEGLPIYDAVSYLSQPLPFWPSADFFAEVIFTGTLYAPPAVLLFLPLGYFGYREAFILWSIVQAVVLAAVAVLMKHEFFRGGSRDQQIAAWFAVICLAAFFAPVKATLYAGQFNLIMALLFMLVWGSRRNALAGVWIGLGMCIKPYFGILLLWLLVRLRFGTMMLAAGTVALAFAIAAGVFGVGDVTTYFLDNPIARAPRHLYTQDVNLSALAVLRRATDARTWAGSAVMHGPYIAFALLVTALTAWSVWRCTDDRWALVACTSLGLLLAPQSLYHYCTVLLPAMAYIVVYNGFKWRTMSLVVMLFALASFEHAAFWFNLSVWVIAASYPWWGAAAANSPAAGPLAALVGLLSRRSRKTVSNSEPGASGTAQDRI